MISKTKLKELAQYKHQRNLDDDSLFVVEGTKMVSEAMLSGCEIRAICALPAWFSSHSLQGVSPDAVYEVSNEDLERLSNFRTPNEVWMLLERPKVSQVDLATPCPILVLDHLQDPGNMGTIIRTADWFGIRHIVASEDSVNCWNPKVVQSTMGGIFRVAVSYCRLEEYLPQLSLPVYGMLLDGADMRTIEPPAGKAFALVIGNESQGISPSVERLVTHKVFIPNLGGTCESLNAASATAIACFWAMGCGIVKQ